MEEKIIQVLNESRVPMKSGEIAEAAGMDKKEVDNVIKKLKTAAVIDSPKRCFYTLSK